MTSVYAYLDYRQYLTDAFAEKRGRNPDYSYRSIARALGINSGTLVRILKAERNISKNLLPRFLDYLRLKEREREYFSVLVQFNQAKRPAQQRSLYQSLTDLRNERKRSVEPDKHEFYEQWYYTALRELLRINPRVEDVEDVARTFAPAIKSSEVLRALEVLTRHGFIEKGPNRSYSVKDPLLTTGDKWHSAAIQQFQISMMQKGVEAIDRFPKAERDISTMTMTFSEQGLERVREVVKKARAEISEIESSDSAANRVFQVNLQVFPLTSTVTRE